MRVHRNKTARESSGTSRRSVRDLTNHIALIPFLLVSLCFVLSGMEELLPDSGIYGILWTLTAILVLIYAVYSLAVRSSGAMTPAEAQPQDADAVEWEGADLSAAELLQRVDALLGPMPRAAVDSSDLEAAGLEAEHLGGYALDLMALESAGIAPDSGEQASNQTLSETEPQDSTSIPEAERSVFTVGGVSLDATDLELAGLPSPGESGLSYDFKTDSGLEEPRMSLLRRAASALHILRGGQPGRKEAQSLNQA